MRSKLKRTIDARDIDSGLLHFCQKMSETWRRKRGRPWAERVEVVLKSGEALLI